MRAARLRRLLVTASAVVLVTIVVGTLRSQGAPRAAHAQRARSEARTGSQGASIAARLQRASGARTARVPGVTVPTAAGRRPAQSTTTTAPPATTTTVDPGTLPQTSQLPTATDPAFVQRMRDLFQAVVTGNTALGLPAFFPLSAYIQVKAISNPQADYQDRLIAYYDQDISTLHEDLGAGAASATFTGVQVPENQAEWIVPGVEYNKGSYWRVYGAEVTYSEGGQSGQFPIASLISWRGEWYVVHLNSIR